MKPLTTWSGITGADLGFSTFISSFHFLADLQLLNLQASANIPVSRQTIIIFCFQNLSCLCIKRNLVTNKVLALSLNRNTLTLALCESWIPLLSVL